MKRLRFLLEAIGLRLALALIRLLPVDAASNLGGRLGRTFGPGLPVSGKARANLRLAFPEMSAAAHEAILRGMWDNLGRVAFEYAHLDRITEPAAGRVVWGDTTHLDALRDAGRAAVLASGHVANWEVAAIAVVRHGVDLTVIVREPNNPLVRSTIDRLRGVAGGARAPKGAAGAKQAIGLLKANRVLGLLYDQRASDGIAVPLFGIDAMTAAAPAQLALRFRCPLIPIRIERTGPARFRMTVQAPVTLPDSGSRQADTIAVMAELNRILERWIRARPEQWLWLHRRWPEAAFAGGPGDAG